MIAAPATVNSVTLFSYGELISPPRSSAGIATAAQLGSSIRRVGRGPCRQAGSDRYKVVSAGLQSVEIHPRLQPQITQTEGKTIRMPFRQSALSEARDPFSVPGRSVLAESQRFLQALYNSWPFTNIRHLDTSRLPKIHTDRDMVLSLLRGIESLRLSPQTIDHAHLPCLSRLTNLELVNIQQDRLTSLSHLSTLRRLDIGGTRQSEWRELISLRCCTRLEVSTVIRIGGCERPSRSQDLMSSS